MIYREIKQYSSTSKNFMLNIFQLIYTEFVVRECASKKMKKVFILFTKCWKGEKSLFGAEIFVRPNKPETFKIIWVIKN